MKSKDKGSELANHHIKPKKTQLVTIYCSKQILELPSIEDMRRKG